MEFDLIVVGGGLAGTALAVALQESGLRIALIEARQPAPPSTEWDARIYAVSPANARFLDEIGIWKHLDSARMAPVHAMDVAGDAGGRIRFSASDSGLGELAWILESGRLQHELWETARRQRNVTVLTGAMPSELAIDADRARLTLADGQAFQARLVVGADGVNSWVRRQANITDVTTPYGEQGVVANFECARPHRNVAFQWFRPDGILALLPLPGQRVSMVWSCDEAFASALVAMTAEELAVHVGDAAKDALGPLRVLTPAAGFPLRLMRVETIVKSRVALLGDAAHAIHPLSGHGINLGFQDVKMLAEVLTTLPKWRDPGELGVLRRYARARAEEPFLMQYTTHGLNRLFASSNPVMSLVRNAGLNLTDRLPLIRDALVRYAVTGRF